MLGKIKRDVNMDLTGSDNEDDVKYCQGQSCKDLPEGRAAVKICHHSDCREINNMTPLLLCEDCDRDVHVESGVSHMRFDLPKTFRRTPSVKSNNSDSGTEDDSDPRFDKKYRGYASARKFFNISAGSRKKARRHNTDDPGREFIKIRFYDDEDGSYQVEILPALKGKSLKESIEHMYENRNLSFDTHSVFLEASNTPLPLAFDTFPLGGNVLHVRAIQDMKVDERIIAMAKQERDDNDRKSAFTAVRKDSVNKIYSSQRSRKNIMAYLGEEEQKASLSSPESTNPNSKSRMPQRRSGLFSAPRLKDVSRTFQDVLSFFTVHGIESDVLLQDKENNSYDPESFRMEESWTMVISYSPDMPKKLRDQQEAIWELLTTEVSYISKLRVIIELFQLCLEGLQAEKHLLDVEPDKLFGNIKQVYNANVTFWKHHLKGVVDKARQEKSTLSPDVLKNGFMLFPDIFLPYIQYCTEENHCLQYLKSKMKESEKFRDYLAWCENHKLCNRLKLTDLLVKPMQRVTKYPLLLKAILKKTPEEDQRQSLQEMINKVEGFVSKVNTTVRIRQERKKLQDVILRIDTYSPIDPVNDEVERILADHCAFNLEGSVPALAENEHRCVLKEGPMKLTEKQGRSDVYVFLFTDMVLITKLKRGIDKYRIIKQPYRLSKVVLHPLRESNGFLFIYLNEYNVLVNAFVLTCIGSSNEQQDWMDAIKTAKRRYVSARLGQGSTYDFFDDNSLLPFQPSPQHSPQPLRRVLTTNDNLHEPTERAKSAELTPSVTPSVDEVNEMGLRKPRSSSSIEPKSTSSPSVNEAVSHRVEAVKVTRSRSDPKAEKNPRLATVTERGRSGIGHSDSNYWNGTRPVSMVTDTSYNDFSMSSILEERRSRSESLPTESEDSSLRNDRFRNTNSDTALSHNLPDGDVVKGSNSAPIVNDVRKRCTNSKGSPGVEDFTSDENSISSMSLSSENHIGGGSVSSSCASVNIDRSPSESGLDRIYADNPYRSLDELERNSDLENCSDDPSYLPLIVQSDLKESSVDDDLNIYTRQRTQALSGPRKAHRNTDVTSIEVQTDFAPLFESVGIQCNLIERLAEFGSGERNVTIANLEKAVSVDLVELTEDDPRNLLVVGPSLDADHSRQGLTDRPGLRHSVSESDIGRRFRAGSDGHIHSRSLSDGIKSELQVKSTPSSPRGGKRLSLIEGPGMRALHVLSQNLETSIHGRSMSVGAKPMVTNDSNLPKPLKRMSSSPRSLRRFVLMNTSPSLERKFAKESKSDGVSPANYPKHPGALSKMPKRASWHVDTISELEKMEKVFVSPPSRSDLSDISSGEKEDKLAANKSQTNKSNKKSGKGSDGKRRPGNINGKRWTISEMPGGIVSGPNLDRRGARRFFLEESLMFDEPEYV